MKNIINIQTIKWELETNSVAQAKEWQNKASSFSNSQLPAIIEDTLAPYNDEFEQITIDTLQLDVKDINDVGEIKRSLQKSIEAFFSTYTTEKNSNTLLHTYSFLEALQYYLQHGSLPWHADKKAFAQSEVFLQHLKSFSAGSIKSVIRISNNAAAIRLLQLLGEPKLIMQFLQHVSVAISNQIEEMVLFIQKIFNTVSNIQTQNSNNKIITYKVLLQYLFETQIFNATTFFEFWWSDIVENQLLSASEQKDVTNFVSLHTFHTPIITANGNIFITQHKQWMDDVNKAIANNANTSANNIRQQKTDATPTATSFYIENAGGILLHHYLRTFFNNAGLLNSNSLFISNSHKMQAVKLLQFAICGHSNFKEYDLVLNKVLCGYDLEAPIIMEDASSLYDIEAANNMLQAIINAWQKIANTSPDSLRQSFLLRPGKLVNETNNWVLYIERRSYDILIDTLPFPISVVKSPWMQKPMYVQW